MGNTARDYAKELGEARSVSNENLSNVSQLQSPGQFNVPQHGAAGNYGGAPKEGSADNYSQNEGGNHADRLAEARKRDAKAGKIKNTASMANDIAKNLSPTGRTTLLKQIDFLHDIPFFAAFGAALLKDALDFIGIGSLPAIGTVVTICVSLFIGAMLLLSGSGGKRHKAVAKRWIRRFGVLGSGTLGEMFFGLNFLPIETITVFIIYTMTLKDRMRSENNL